MKKVPRDRHGHTPRELWLDALDEFAPSGLSSQGLRGSPNDINDAYRHFASAALSAVLLGPDLTYSLGVIQEARTLQELASQMDLANNDAGIRAARSSRDRFEISMKFIDEVAEGHVKIIDPVTGNLRDSNISDLPGHRDGDAVEDRYLPRTGIETQES